MVKDYFKGVAFHWELREEKELAKQRSGGREYQAKGAARAKALRQKWLRVFWEQRGREAVAQCAGESPWNEVEEVGRGQL